MRAVVAILRELLGLFVDDGSLAIVALVWIGLCALLTSVASPSAWSGVVLFAGLALLLVENAARSARRKGR